MDHVSHKPGVDVCDHQFSDHVYTDNATFFVSSAPDAAYCVAGFNHLSSTLSLRVSWAKTKIQNIGSGPQPPVITVDGNTVEQVDNFFIPGQHLVL